MEVFRKGTIIRFAILIFCGAAIIFFCVLVPFSFAQTVSILIFSASALATLLFWESRLAIAFLGIAGLILTRTIDTRQLIFSSSLDVILFLVGMMIVVGLFREINFFEWVLCHLICLKKMSAKKMVAIICLSSALLACLVDEVASIILISSMVFVLSDYFEVNPIPLLIIAVLSTNIGSAGMVLGNPVGILIATKAGLTFEDFLLHAFPLMLTALFVAIGIILFWYRDQIKKLDFKIREFGVDRDTLARLICLPMSRDIRKELFVFLAILTGIGLHHRIECALQLPKNSLLLSIPLISAGAIMLWRGEKAKGYIEKDVDWGMLIFFLLLFAKAGTLKYTGVCDIFSGWLAGISGGNQFFITSFILLVSSVGSSLLDNMVLITGFIPVIEGLKGLGMENNSFWWALHFGGCLGGNITMVGSTANIVALGMLEKRGKSGISFFQWLKIGSVVGAATTLVVWFFLTVFMPFFRI